MSHIINVNEVNDLKIPTRAGLSPHQPFLIIYFHGIRSPRIVDDEFRFLGVDVVQGNLLAIPLDPEFMGHARASSQHK